MHRKSGGYTITDVHKFIRFNRGWEISFDAIRKFDRGERPPAPEYVVFLKEFFHLTEEQYTALLDAIVGDYKVALFETFEEAMKNIENLDKKRSR